MNSEAQKAGNQDHRITVHARKSMQVLGVTDVLSFDEQAVMLNTLCGGMEISGGELHIQVLNMEDGVVALDGRIDSITYFDRESTQKAEKSGFFGRLFR